MRRALRVVAGLIVGCGLLSAPALAQAPQAESSLHRAGAAQQGPLDIRITDGLFTDDDPRVEFSVVGCTGDDVAATSEAFASSSYDPAEDTVTARVADRVGEGEFDVTFTCSDPQASQTERYRLNRGPAPDPPDDGDDRDGDDRDEDISIKLTDGLFASDDRRVRFRVFDCASNRVTTRSSIFSDASYDRGSRRVTATVERGTESGTYRIIVTCAGQSTLRTRASINAGVGDEDGFPEGGVDTGRGGAADAEPIAPVVAGGLLLALALPALVWLVGSGRLSRRRDVA